jgi:hypothetical protein
LSIPTPNSASFNEKNEITSGYLRIRNNLTAHGDAIVRTHVITGVVIKDGRNISDTTLCIAVVLASAPLPNLPIIDVGFARRMVEAQGSTGESWDGISVVCDASEPASKFAVHVVGEILVSDLHKKV